MATCIITLPEVHVDASGIKLRDEIATVEVDTAGAGGVIRTKRQGVSEKRVRAP